MQLFVQSQREAGDHDELIQIESEDEIGDDFGLACEAPEGYVDRGGDCDDADVSSYPGAEEICGDRADNDCAGDGDPACRLYLLTEGPYSDADLTDADAVLNDEDRSLDFFSALGVVPDLDGDGIDDLVVGASGANTVYVHLGPVSGQRDLGDSDFDFTGSTGGRLAMALAAPGDIDGDGWNDILLSGPGHLFDGGTDPYTGQAYLFLGPITADRTAEDASAELYLGPGHDESLLGRSACTGDIDGDGLLDVALGAPGAGRKHSTVLNDSGDANGDGRADILIGAPHNNDDEDSNGAVFIFYGSVTGTAESSDADATLAGEGAENYAGLVAGGADADGDGFDDLLVGAPGESTNGTWAGAAYLVRGGDD